MRLLSAVERATRSPAGGRAQPHKPSLMPKSSESSTIMALLNKEDERPFMPVTLPVTTRPSSSAFLPFDALPEKVKLLIETYFLIAISLISSLSVLPHFSVLIVGFLDTTKQPAFSENLVGELDGTQNRHTSWQW